MRFGQADRHRRGRATGNPAGAGGNIELDNCPAAALACDRLHDDWFASFILCARSGARGARRWGCPSSASWQRTRSPHYCCPTTLLTFNSTTILPPPPPLSLYLRPLTFLTSLLQYLIPTIFRATSSGEVADGQRRFVDSLTLTSIPATSFPIDVEIVCSLFFEGSRSTSSLRIGELPLNPLRHTESETCDTS